MKKTLTQKNNFSVSMSVYKNDNTEHFNLALDSVINQTVKPSEIVLVVDGPVSDNLNDSIRKATENNDCLNVVRLYENRGHGEARRIGLENCSNEIVALMDSDDICLPDRFEKQLISLKENKNLSIVGGQIEEFDDEINEIIGIRRVPLTDVEIKTFLKKRCPMNQMTVMFRKSNIQNAGGYLDWHNNEDYYLWIRMVLGGHEFLNLNDTLVNVRVNKKMYKRRGGFKYFRSEANLQKFMYDNGVINYLRYLMNISIRFVIQVVLPNNFRQFFFTKIIRN